VALVSNIFKSNTRLQSCLVLDASHVTPGSSGDHVALIQIALNELDGLMIDGAEVAAKRYGPSTAAAVLAFKKKRKIINFAYQKTEDNIVGKMTIAALDKEMFDRQFTPSHVDSNCKRLSPTVDPPVASSNLIGKQFVV
jgi:peptidoglycan hydrolase-like protein with peptidoglycan-binding domain